jgi:hypothetical protein
LYKFFKAKRPEKTLSIDSPFYLSVNHTSANKLALPETKWFKPMGVNKLNSLMKDCAEMAEIGLDKRITESQCSKDTSTNTPRQKRSANSNNSGYTGHKNLQSVNNYSTLKEKQQEDISTIFSSSLLHTANFAEHSSTNLKQDVSRKSAVYLVQRAVSRQLHNWRNIQCACCLQFFSGVPHNGLAESKKQKVSSSSSFGK